MSDDNLLLFPKKSRPNISMSQAEAKWMVAGSLLVVLTVALGVNSALFNGHGKAGNLAQINDDNTRAIASINPIVKVSWEKKAFEVLEKTQGRDLANVGKPPSPFDQFAFGRLEGKYQVRKVDGKITEVRFAEIDGHNPQALLEREQFLQNHLTLFSDQATKVRKFHQEGNDQRLLERYEMLGKEGQSLGVVQVLLDQNQNLIAMTVQ